MKFLANAYPCCPFHDTWHQPCEHLLSVTALPCGMRVTMSLPRPGALRSVTSIFDVADSLHPRSAAARTTNRKTAGRRTVDSGSIRACGISPSLLTRLVPFSGSIGFTFLVLG